MKPRLVIQGVACALAAAAAFAVSFFWHSGSDLFSRTVLIDRLGLTPEQAARIEGLDPRYREEVATMATGLDRSRRTLAELLERSDASDTAILEQVERVIAAHNALERRVVEHLVAMRAQLEPGQRLRLGQLVGREVRQGLRQGWRVDDPTRPRHGLRGTGQEHGRGLRRADPFFRGLVERHPEIAIHLEETPDGVQIAFLSGTPEAVETLRQEIREALGPFGGPTLPGGTPR